MSTVDVPAANEVRAPFKELRTLWFQVTGLHCNLACTHCLVSSGPDNHTLRYLELAEVERTLGEGEALGVKEIYFTGGEPFMHPALLEMLEAALRVAPATVLTNGTLIDEAVADRLRDLAAQSRYTLEIRVSLDDVDAAINDRIRGHGVLRRVGRAIRLLDERGLLPILTATEIVRDEEAAHASGVGELPGADSLYERFRGFLIGLGIEKPRVKIMPVFRAGRLAGLARATQRITPAMLEGFDFDTLQCHTGRVVAAGGIYACPILVGQPVARLSGEGALAGSFAPADLTHPACHTCYVTGMTCANT